MFMNTTGEIYQIPGKCPPPSDLSMDTDFPNLNSRDYAQQPLNEDILMYNAWECVALNSQQNLLLGTNKLHGREWFGTVWGFKTINEEPKAENAYLKMACKSLISQLQYVTDELFAVALDCGALQIWSFCIPKDCSKSISVYKCSERAECYPIVSMDVLKNGLIFTGGKGGTLKQWNVAEAELKSLAVYKFAHLDIITGVSASSLDPNRVATCSLDKSALIWDLRENRPARAVIENHHVRFGSIAFTESEPDSLFVGDEIGIIHEYDLRKLQRSVQTTDCFNHQSIRKIVPSANNLAVVGDTKTFKVLGKSDTYEDSTSGSVLRDASWFDPQTVLTVGFEGKLRKHTINF